MKGKIFTIAGIVLIFGYFIWDSMNDPLKNPGAVVLSGNDTLGRDWGAAADAKEKAANEKNQANVAESGPSSAAASKDLLNGQNPYQTERYTPNYQTMQSADGRTIITGNEQQEENPEDRYKSRHELEKGTTNTSPEENPYYTPYGNPYGNNPEQQNQPVHPY